MTYYSRETVHDAVINQLFQCSTVDQVEEIIAKLPAADVRPVVLCRECIFRSNEWTGCPKLNGIITGDEFFCKCGTKKKEES